MKDTFLFLLLCFVQWGFLGPSKHVFVHISIIAAKHRSPASHPEIKCIHQKPARANRSQQLLYALIHLGDLRLCHDAPLKGRNEQASTDVIRYVYRDVYEYLDTHTGTNCQK